MRKTLVLGRGLLGAEFAITGYDTVNTSTFKADYNVDNYETIEKKLLNICRLRNCQQMPTTIVNCIGISDTRYCEDPKNWQHVSFINGILPGYISRFCQLNNIKFVHISTGCVYEESHRPCTEDDSIVAHCNYVTSKWMGELGCDKSRDIIIRPRLLFGDFIPANNRRNNLLCKLHKFNTFVDAYNSVTYIKDIVNAVNALVKNDQVGVFNVACPEVVTIYQLATDYLKLTGRKMTPEELRKGQNLYLVNNCMDVSKVSKFCQMTPLSTAIAHCYNKLNLDPRFNV